MSTLYRDIALDADGDWDFAGADFTLVSGLAAIRQAVQIALSFFKGEWYGDTSLGVPYFQDVLVKGASPQILSSVFRKAILDVPGVLDLLSLDIAVDTSTRSLSVTFTASTDLGEIEATVPLTGA